MKCLLDCKFLQDLSLYNPRVELNICDLAKGPGTQIWKSGHVQFLGLVTIMVLMSDIIVLLKVIHLLCG